MRRHHYGRNRYDLIESGVLVVNVKVSGENTDDIELQVMELADQLDRMTEFEFSHKNWEYEQKFKCKIGTTEMLIERMMDEKFLNALWAGKVGPKERFRDVTFRVETSLLPCNAKTYRVPFM